LDIDGECRLIVEYEDGSREALSSGEVSIRPTGMKDH
jgi:biotin-(acetyl-CoA carboxylase) ligase